MLDLFGPTLVLHCESHQFIVQRRSHFGTSVGAPILVKVDGQAPAFAHPAHQLHQLFLTQLGNALTDFDCKDAVVNVVIPDAWCRLFVTTPPSNMASRLDCTAAVAMRFQTLYGESADAWLLQADWQVRKPFLAAAMPKALRDDLLAILRARKLRLSRLVPESIDAWNRCCGAVSRGDWFAQLSDTAMTLIVLDGEQLRHIVQQPRDAIARNDPNWLTHFVQREALRLNLPIPVRIACAGNVPAAWRKVGVDAQRDADADINAQHPLCFVIAEKPHQIHAPRHRAARTDAVVRSKSVKSGEPVE